MEDLINFFIKIGKLKKKKRRGWILRGIKDPESIAAHTFRMAIMAWLFSTRKRLNITKILKMSLIHDLCEVYAGDTTPYDSLLPKNKRKLREIVKKWPRFSKREKEKIFREKYKKEKKALEKLILKLPPPLKKEIRTLWADYENGLTPEGRFIRQLDRVENLLQALEYWQENKEFPIGPWWIQIGELVDDPILLEFLKSLDKKFHRK